MADDTKREYQIPGISSAMIGSIIEYAYTRETDITADNVDTLLPAADQFNVVGLVRACADFITNQLGSENCIGIRNFARQYFCRHLERQADNYLMQNFVDVATKSDELMSLQLSEFTEIMSCDELNVKNEEAVFETVIKWIDHDPDSRKECIIDLLKVVRMGLLNTQFFVEKVKSHKYIKDNESCKPIIIDTLKFLYDLDMDDDKELDLSDPLARPRVPHEFIFVVGGWSGGSPTNAIETYDTRADRWIACEQVDTPRAYHGTAAVRGMVYVVGGFDGMDYFNSVRAFDPYKKVWTEKAPMHCKRCYVSVAVLNDQVYAMGGFNGHVRQNTAERYAPDTNQWSMITPMNMQRSDASGTTHNGRVYICGGFNGQECMSSAEYYDPDTEQWTLVASMRNRRSGVGVIAHGEYVYAVGGFNGITRMNTAERYNPSTNTWTSITEMYNPRSNFAIEVLDDMIFGIGGFNGVTTIFNVECYDPESDEWYDATDMTIFRSALSACVLKDIPNIREYLHKNRTGEIKRRELRKQ
ncbi:kelch-like protein 10 [Tubulanus polymorphus]|uniref:kelch-like protein 10 n=1 Tax=Tubulanus polymorphus TaxID=672921 RepID=UPI003DA280EE